MKTKLQHEEVIVTPLPNHKWKVLEEIVYKDITIPKGYVTNGADVPRVLWSFLPPNQSDYFPAVVVHDYMCDLDDPRANQYFVEILEQLKIDDKKIFAFKNGVNFYFKYIKKGSWK